MNKNEIETFLKQPDYALIIGGKHTTENLDALWLLKNTDKRKDYIRLLSLIILNAHMLNQDELEWLADFVKKPFVGKSGRPPIEKLGSTIISRYMLFNDGSNPDLRKNAINEISVEFKMMPDTARKHFDKHARKIKERKKV